jgi:hypothetical protein
MASNTETYGNILALGHDTMNEGDYLQLATFLKNLHKTNEAPEIMSKTSYSRNIGVKYETYKSNRIYEIKINTVTKIWYRGRGSTIMIVGTVDDTPFELDDDTFIDLWNCRLTFLGAKNIRRSMDGIEETFETQGDFIKYVKQREKDTILEEDLADYDPCLRDTYYTRCLLGCDIEID